MLRVITANQDHSSTGHRTFYVHREHARLWANLDRPFVVTRERKIPFRRSLARICAALSKESSEKLS